MLQEQVDSRFLVETAPLNQSVPVGPKQGQIVVPTTLAAAERPALELGLELAARYRATLTLLQVLPPPVTRRPAKQGLDALDHLAESAWGLHSRRAVAELPPELVEQMKARGLEFLERETSSAARQDVQVCVECRQGDAAREIARFANEVVADLVILSSSLRSWRLPILPARARRVLRLSQRPVVMVRPDGRHTPSRVSHAAERPLR